jgi:hypothetical protein
MSRGAYSCYGADGSIARLGPVVLATGSDINNVTLATNDGVDNVA